MTSTPKSAYACIVLAVPKLALRPLTVCSAAHIANSQTPLSHGPCPQTESVQSVVDILGCTSSTARVLLTFFRWDTEALFGALAERGPEWVYKAASVTSRSDVAPTTAGSLWPCLSNSATSHSYAALRAVVLNADVCKTGPGRPADMFCLHTATFLVQSQARAGR